MKSSLRAILFDFDGVLADTEPVHMRLFQTVLEEEGVSLTEDEYYEKYLGLDDRACFDAVFRDRQKRLSEAEKGDLTRVKHERMLHELHRNSLLQPGVPEFVEGMAQKYYLAVVSGALASEIEAVLTQGGIRDRFRVVVAAEDVSEGKPSPEGFIKAVRLLNRDFVPSSEILLPQECIVIEDSPWGIEAAHRAGIKCLALMTSYPREKLESADLVVPNLRACRWEQVEALFPIAGHP